MSRTLLVLAALILGAWTHGNGGGGGSPTINSVVLSSAAFSAPCSAGTNIGAVTVTMSSGGFSGSLSLSGTDAASFQLSGSTLQCAGSAAAGSYSVNLVATQAGATNSPFTQPETIIGSSGGSTPFAALHTYFMAPASGGGSDSNNGTSAASPWLTTNHAAIVCGDVIIAANGTYAAGGLHVSTNPGTCPSTTGGIDGIGGIYFANVICNTAFSCTMSYTGSGGTAGIDVAANNWAFQGWQITTSGGNAGCFSADAGASGTTQRHHIAFINDICNNSGIGYFTQDNGLNHNVPGNGIDYWAVLDSISWNANQRADFPTASIVAVGVSNVDNNAGTHILFDGNFAINNAVPVTSTAYSDLEAYMFDSPDVHGFTGQMVMKNNVGYNSSSWGIQIFSQSFNSSTLDIEVAQNTLYGNNTCTPFSQFASGEINEQLNGGFPWTVNTYNNVALTNRLTVGCNGSGGDVYAMVSGGTLGSLTLNVGGAGKQNVFKGLQTTCQGSCDAGKNIAVFNSFPLGTNTYTDPLFQNTTDLLANQLAQPSCGGYSDVSACMGWNYASQTASVNSVVGDLTATASGTTGKGFQPPAACAADALYPSWLKGEPYLVWNGSSVVQMAGGVNRPCGL